MLLNIPDSEKFSIFAHIISPKVTNQLLHIIMKKSLTFILLSLLGNGLMRGEHLTPIEALARVKDNSQARKVISNRSIAPQLIAELPELYVFSSGDGFMILPADDAATPLLAYADSGEFCPERIPALKWWLSTYSAEIANATAAGISTNDDATTQERTPVEPLMKTTWNQDSPYNNQAPELNNRKCYTGCVATAMAQVMKYHNWPAQGKGSITYTWKTNNNEQLTMDFSDVTFDWNNMADSYNSSTTEAQDNAVATLMKACGYSVKMDYSTIGSGANPVLIGGALINYFDYDQGIWQPQRDSYELAEWEDMIYADLAAGLPVIYGGQSVEGGHQFVCDGYSEDGFFHFNWGWGGMSDGYFRLNALNPGAQGIGGFAGGYNMNQSVTLGVRPPVDGSKPVYVLSSSDKFIPAAKSVQLGGYVIFNCYVANSGAVSIPASTQIAVEFTPVDGSEPVYIISKTTPTIAPTLGYGSIDIQIPTTMPEGTYTARLVFKTPGGEWQPVVFPLSSNSELTATVSDSKISFVAENEPGFTITDLPENKTIYIGATFAIPMTLTNKTDKEYIGSMYPMIIKSDSDDEVGWGTNVPVEISGGQTMTYNYVGKLQSKTGIFEPGSYRLYFYSQQTNSPLCDTIPVTIAQMPEKTSYEVTDLKFLGMQPGDKAKFSMTVTCTEGYFDSYFLLVIWYSNGESAIYDRVSLMLEQGQSQEVTCEMDMSNLEFGDYRVSAYDNGSSITPYVNFSYSKESTEIHQISSKSTDSAIYDLQGRRVINPASNHIYIRSGKLFRQ